MDLSKLSQALGPAYLGDTANLTVSDKFSIKIVYMSKTNQPYTAKLAEFCRKFPDHKVVKKPQEFQMQWFGQEHNPETVSFMAHVILAGWTLTDDTGADVPFDANTAIQLLCSPVGRTIFGKLIQACQWESTFQLDWSEDAVKN